jgi:lipoprotein-anchoring transpeptidase ErfK/SrfK
MEIPAQTRTTFLRAACFRVASCRAAPFSSVSLIGCVLVSLVATTHHSANAASATTKRSPNSVASTTVAKGTTAGGSAKATRAKKGGQVLQPGKPLEGWAQRGASDWPGAESALVAEPIEKTILVRKKPDFSTPGIVLSSGGSVSGELGLLIVGESNGWWKVLMPVRPNGTVGWVQQSSVRTSQVNERIVVDLSANTITLYDSGKVVRSESAATGTSGTPTPDGLFFVKAIVPQANVNAGRGPFVLVLSAFSTVLNTFDGGQGAVGIHGTGTPSKIGQKVSHGCVRVRNETIIELAEKLSPGTPVEILKRPSDAPKKRWVRSSGTDSGTSPDVDTPQDTTPSATTTVPNASDGGSVESAQPPVTAIP